MDLIADASSGRHGSKYKDNTMENNSFDSDNQVESNSSDEYEIDTATGKRTKQYFDSEDQRKLFKQRKMVQRMKQNIGQFFSENQIADLLPYNQKLVVLNHEMTITQTIEAMVRQQNVRSAIIWNNDKREYQQILSLRDLLECTLYVADKLQDVITVFEQARGHTSVVSDMTFNNNSHISNFDLSQTQKMIRENAQLIRDSFLEKYIYNTTNHEISKDDESHDDQREELRSGQTSLRHQMRGFELIYLIFDQITLQDWIKVQRSKSFRHIHHFHKAELIDLDINAKISQCVQLINEKSYNFVALATNEKSQLQGLINTHDILSFLINNYQGEIDFFKHSFQKFETQNYISHFSKNQNLVRAQHTDSLYEVLLKLRDNRVSMISVERQFVCQKTQRDKVETVGIVFLTDLMFILKQLNFHEILTQPVINFVISLNGTDEDKKLFKERDGQLDNNFFSDATSSEFKKKSTATKRESPQVSDDGEGDGMVDEEHGEDSFFVFNKNDDPTRRKRKQSIKGNSKPHQVNRDDGHDDILIDDLFSNIFGIERVHILTKSDSLQDVLEKVTLVPEHKLVYVEKEEDQFIIQNVLTLGDLLTYICPGHQEN